MQQQTDLRIHPFGFSWRYVKKFRIELIDVIDKAAPFAIRLILGPAVFVEPRPEIPMVGRNLFDQIFPGYDIFPKRFDIGRFCK
ncbi:hypothetical protein P4V64_18570 [Bacillus thuringiensis]|nr:hypothetical protein [Bacillus thuringiensis]